MTKKTDQLEGFKELAKKVLITKGSHLPQIMIDSGEGKFILGTLMFEDDIEKTLMNKMMRHEINSKGFSRYFIIFEGWIGQNKNVRPTFDKNRTEALVIMEYRRNQKNKGFYIPFKRNNNKIVFEKEIPIKQGQFSSRWNFFLEETDEEYDLINKLNKS